MSYFFSNGGNNRHIVKFLAAAAACGVKNHLRKAACIRATRKSFDLVLEPNTAAAEYAVADHNEGIAAPKLQAVAAEFNLAENSERS